MTSSSHPPIDITPGPDLHPIYPSPSTLAPLLESSSGLDPTQKVELVSHSLGRACLFGDLPLLSFLFSDPQAQAFVDLGISDEDGLGPISLTIFGFGPESDRDVEREECIRFLVSEGADVNHCDNGGLKFTSFLTTLTSTQPAGLRYTMQLSCHHRPSFLSC
jgi:hypothetical protein